MIYQEFAPKGLLSKYVQLIWIMEAPASSEIMSERIMPDGIVEFVFHFGDPYETIREGCLPEKQNLGFAISQAKQFIEIRPTGKTGIIAVRCYPWGAHHFINIPTFNFLDQSISMEHLWGNEYIDLLEKINVSDSLFSKVELVEKFLINQLEKHNPKNDDIDLVVHHLRHSSGRATLDEVCADFGYSKRTLERKFRETVGVSPKVFSRLSRFLNICHYLEHHRHKSLSEITYECGYYDQAHFIREFKAFSGMTPRKYFEKPNVSFASL